jgi:hypothetical protein
MMPMRALLTRTTPNRASWGGATTRMTTSRTPNSTLNSVKTFDRMMSATVRLGPLSTRLTAPAAMR